MKPRRFHHKANTLHLFRTHQEIEVDHGPQTWARIHRPRQRPAFEDDDLDAFFVQWADDLPQLVLEQHVAPQIDIVSTLGAGQDRLRDLLAVQIPQPGIEQREQAVLAGQVQQALPVDALADKLPGASLGLILETASGAAQEKAVRCLRAPIHRSHTAGHDSR